MFKKLALALCLVLILAVSGAWAAEPGQECTLIQGMKVFQTFSDGQVLPVKVPADISIEIGPELTPEMIVNLNQQSSIRGTTMDWSEGNKGIIIVDFGDGDGPSPLALFVKEGDVKDCK